MSNKAMDYVTNGEWRIFFKPWNGKTYRKVLTNDDRSIDIEQLDIDEYKIYSSLPIINMHYYYHSPSKHEPRPYYYKVNSDELNGSIYGIDEYLLSEMDNHRYIKNSNNKLVIYK